MTLQADEGMWLFTNPPRQILKQKYGFELTDAWLERVQKASVRFNNGASGAFVSRDGLVVTNHHVGADSLQKLSRKDRDIYSDGFLARSRGEELKCQDLELNVLLSIEDVTARVNGAVKPEMAAGEAAAARRAVMADIEKESLTKTGLRSDVVTLYQGGLYHLYRYKKYTDVRLVMSPEKAIASFGGDTDNYEYPRFCLDVCFFRVYEKDQPVQLEHWLRWSAQGPAEGDLVLVSGHPGVTSRMDTLARLVHRRDLTLPYLLNRTRNMEAALQQYAERSSENDRQAQTDIRRVANQRKAMVGQHQGLLDSSILKRKQGEEATLHDAIERDPARRQRYGDPWQRIAEAQDKFTSFEKEYALVETGDGFDSVLFRIARHLVRLAAEKPKPNAERLREYRDSNLESLELQLFSPAPIYKDLEQARLTAALTFLAENLGGSHPIVVKVLAGGSPAHRAGDLIQGTRLEDVAERRRVAKDAGALTSSKDTLIALVQALEPEARALRKRFEELEEIERQAYGAIARARFELEGTTTPPDATFTLRLAFGAVRGYRVDGADLPFHTTFGGVYERTEQQRHREPFTLPRRWLDRKDRLDLPTPFNFVATSDTINGNSGSPVLNQAGEVVGINFDRNRHGLVRNFVYTEEQARHISVHSRAVIEVLRRLYDAQALADELLAR